jgi:hypothetical protein
VIWYAVYGSNLSRTRFDIYLRGGVPEGATHEYPGCRDPSDPRGDVTIDIGLELAFGGYSQTWGGGVAFVRPGGRALGRAYLITDEQFADVIAQENWLAPGSVGIDGGDFMYGVVSVLGSRDGDEIRTITQAPDTEVRPPTERYLKHIADGLREAYGMPDDAIDDYLRQAPGLR